MLPHYARGFAVINFRQSSKEKHGSRIPAHGRQIGQTRARAPGAGHRRRNGILSSGGLRPSHQAGQARTRGVRRRSRHHRFPGDACCGASGLGGHFRRCLGAERCRHLDLGDCAWDGARADHRLPRRPGADRSRPCRCSRPAPGHCRGPRPQDDGGILAGVGHEHQATEARHGVCSPSPARRADGALFPRQDAVPVARDIHHRGYEAPGASDAARQAIPLDAVGSVASPRKACHELLPRCCPPAGTGTGNTRAGRHGPRRR